MDVVDSLRQLDIDVFRALNHAGQNPILDAAMIGFTVMGFSYVIILLCIPVWIQGKKEVAFDLVVLVIVVSLATEAVKLLVGRDRPYLVLNDVHTLISSSGPSFPSAHASRAFAVALLVALTYARRYGAIAFAVAAFIGVSRVYLGVHWPSDVLFGALFGLAIASLLVLCSKRSAGYREVRRVTVAGIGRIRADSHRAK